jgi:hypothetical protein
MLQSVAIRTVSAVELDAVVPQLVELLRETVNAGGSSLGFVPPVSAEAGLAYWRSLRPELQNGSRVLMVAHAGERIIGTGQLEIPHWPSAPHRAELQKVAVTGATARTFVAHSQRPARRGGGAALQETRLSGGRCGSRIYGRTGRGTVRLHHALPRALTRKRLQLVSTAARSECSCAQPGVRVRHIPSRSHGGDPHPNCAQRRKSAFCAALHDSTALEAE